jgi:hypothetical protein
MASEFASRLTQPAPASSVWQLISTHIFDTLIGRCVGSGCKPLDWDRSGMGWKVEQRTEGSDTILHNLQDGAPADVMTALPIAKSNGEQNESIGNTVLRRGNLVVRPI